MTKLQEILDAIKVQKNRDRYLEWQIEKTISMHHGLSEREMEEQIGHLYRAVTSDLDANLVCRTVVSKIAPESIRIIAERLLLTYTGSATPDAPSRDLVSLPKDSQEIISEKLSQNDADVVTKRQANCQGFLDRPARGGREMTPYKYCTTCGHTWPEDCGCGKHSRPVMAHDEALDWFESLLENMRVPVSTIPEELHAIATNKERARLRALIAAERGKV